MLGSEKAATVGNAPVPQPIVPPPVMPEETGDNSNREALGKILGLSLATFGLGAGIYELLRGYRLTFEDGRFRLVGADNVPHTLRSLAKARSAGR